MRRMNNVWVSLLGITCLVPSALAQNPASVAVNMSAHGSAPTNQDPILFLAAGNISPFGPSLLSVVLYIDALTYTHNHPVTFELIVDNIGAGGKLINDNAPSFKALGTANMTLNKQVAFVTGQATIGEGTYQFDKPDGTLQVSITYALNPNTQTADVTLDASGTVTSAALQEIINQQALAPSVKQVFATVNKTTVKKPVSIGLWNGTQSIIWTAATTTNSGGNWLNTTPSSGTAAPASVTTLNTTVNGAGVSPGVYQGSVQVNGSATPTQSLPPGAPSSRAQSPGFSLAIPVTMIVSSGDELAVSQTGVQFQTSTGVVPAPQTINVSTTGAGSASFDTKVSTLSGGDWLTVTPSSGSMTAAAPAAVSLGVNPANLVPGTYFARVDFASLETANSPQSVLVTLTVNGSGSHPAPVISPAALLFVAAGGSTPAPQTIEVTNPGAQTMNITGQLVFEEGYGWLSLSGTSQGIVPGTPLELTVTASTAGLGPGVYHGSINAQVAATQGTYTVPVILVVTESTSTSQALAPRAACAATQLVPLITTLPDGFQVTAGLPVPLQLTLVDDCGNPLTDGFVTASTDAGDPDIFLTAFGNGQWAGTWTPHNLAGGSSSVMVTANSSSLGLQGSVALSGTVLANTSAPLINTGGVLSSASWTGTAVAPGGFISIFGSNLADGSTLAGSLPLQTTLGGLQVLLSGTPLPLEYAGSGQINAIVPYGAPLNSTAQLVVARNGSAYSLPETVIVAATQPAIFTQDQSGKGFGAILVVKPDQTQFLNTPQTPATAGDALEIFCTGLGAVSPPVADGAAVPPTQLSYTVNPVSVQIGGQTVTPFFAGLAPGFAGLYQVNIIVPPGISTGIDVPLIVSTGGATSPPVTVALQ